MGLPEVCCLSSMAGMVVTYVIAQTVAFRTICLSCGANWQGKRARMSLRSMHQLRTVLRSDLEELEERILRAEATRKQS